jgi:peptidyl-prolyl cis-trans isomerase C
MSRSRRGTCMAALLALAACGDSSSLLAKVGKTEIDRSEYEGYLALKRVAKQDAPRRAKMLEPYLEREALAQAIESQKLLDDKLLQVELDEFKKELLISRYLEKYLEERVNDQAVENYYTSHKAEFTSRRAHAAHILVRAPRGLSESEKQVKLTRAHEALSKARAGEDFAKVAESYSEDAISSRKGGDLGWLKEGGVDPKFSAALFKLKAGELSEPVETAFGYHVIKVLEGPAELAEPFESAANDIRYKLRTAAKEAELKRLAGLVKTERGPAAKTLTEPASKSADDSVKTAKN